ncbi:NUDIX hydrolase [Bradyrhizobium sp. NBAIM03]|nr:NUDIX hydrolase [Bradyrhizobium sp. NBAIM14]MCA1531014.1 NUDIX hydrolase [Bradyrhizobium sp. NBAIM03]
MPQRSCRILYCYRSTGLPRRPSAHTGRTGPTCPTISSAIERYSLELPAAIIEPGETPEDAISRELREESGYMAKAVETIGRSATCASRISNSTTSFFIRTDFRNETSYKSQV